jgi:hypothetical protein
MAWPVEGLRAIRVAECVSAAKRRQDSYEGFGCSNHEILEQVSFQVTLLQVEDLQRVAIGAVLSLMASNSGLSLAPSSRPACGMLTIDTGFRRFSI